MKMIFKKGYIPWNKGKRLSIIHRKNISKGCKKNGVGKWLIGKIIWNKKEKIIKKCLNCGRNFEIYPYRKNIAKYCSYKCQGKSKKGKPSCNKGKKLPQFSGKNAFNWKGGKIKITCKVCKKIFYEFPSIAKVQEYCSKKCMYSDVPIGKMAYHWKGGKITIHGYIFIYSPKHPFATQNKYVREHRLVMEKYLGRYLLKNEIVHHINGIKNDNRLKNLMLFANKKEHQLFHHSNKIIKI